MSRTLIFASFLVMGLAAFNFAHQSHASIVTNGGFETGDFAGWTQSGNTPNMFVGTGGFASHSGAAWATLYPRPPQGLGYLSQTLPTTPSQLYIISFWLRNDTGTNPLNQFVASFNGIPLVNLVGSPSFPYTQFTYTALATTASTVLQFGFQDQDATHDPLFWYLDDVNVEPVVSGVVPELSSVFVWGGLVVTGLSVHLRRVRNLAIRG